MSADRELSAAEAAQHAVRQVTALTGRDAEGVAGVRRTDDGWRVEVEVVESHRIPDSADILAVYEADVDGEGDLVGYRRAARYSRGRTERG